MDLTKRVISAAVLIALLLVTVYFGRWVLVGVCTVIVFLMMLDTLRALKAGWFMPDKYVLAITAAAIMPAIYFYGAVGVILLCLVAMTVIACRVILSPNPDFKTIFSSVFLLVYPLMPGALMLMLACGDVKNGCATGKTIILFAILCSCLSDTFAYFGGRLFGKRKLCPQISPKKTVAGSIASFLGGTAAGVVGMFFIKEAPVYLSVVCGALCGGFAQIGDLLASMLKRFCGIKDYGNYIPGHGGVMDRMDSIITCLIAVTAIFYVFGVISL